MAAALEGGAPPPTRARQQSLAETGGGAGAPAPRSGNAMLPHTGR